MVRSYIYSTKGAKDNFLDGTARNSCPSGVKPKVISEALGHASVAFTMDVYSHIIEGMQSDAMALLDEVMPVGKNGGSQKNNANLTPQLDIKLSKN